MPGKKKGKLKEKAPECAGEDTVMVCEWCKMEVRVGFGSTANLVEHQKSQKCRAARSLKESGSDGMMLGWLNTYKQKPRVTTHISAIPPLGKPQRRPAADDRAGKLIDKLETAVRHIPSSVPEGTEEDMGFAQGFTLALPASVSSEDAWEVIDPILNRVCGSDVPVERIASRVRRGPHGMDCVVSWLRRAVDTFQLPSELLEGKVERICEALQTL